MIKKKHPILKLGFLVYIVWYRQDKSLFGYLVYIRSFLWRVGTGVVEVGPVNPRVHKVSIWCDWKVYGVLAREP